MPFSKQEKLFFHSCCSVVDTFLLTEVKTQSFPLMQTLQGHQTNICSLCRLPFQNLNVGKILRAPKFMENSSKTDENPLIPEAYCCTQHTSERTVITWHTQEGKQIQLVSAFPPFWVMFRISVTSLNLEKETNSDFHRQAKFSIKAVILAQQQSYKNMEMRKRHQAKKLTHNSSTINQTNTASIQETGAAHAEPPASTQFQL